MMNGTLFATVQPTPGQMGGSDSHDAEADFTIPPDLLVHNNTLTIEFIGHYTMVCEDPANTTLWARVHRNTYLDIHGDLLPLADDVKQLPMPFLDPAVIQPLSIPVVFASAPSFKAIQAAGVVTSYFGMISENRPVRFPVHIGPIPQGNAIVISDSPGNLPPGLNLPDSQFAHGGHAHQPQRSLQQNSGHCRRRRRTRCCWRPRPWPCIATCSPERRPPSTASGCPTSSSPMERRAGRAPIRPLPCGITPPPTSCRAMASAPLNVYFRIPPDIYLLRADPTQSLRLVYRYNSIPIGPISSMQMRINNAFLGSVPLIPGQEASKKMQVDVPVPVVNLRPFSNSLSFDFTFQLLKKGGCQDTTPINMQAAILRDTYLDLRGYPHYAPLPNLETFANAGFPFTRLADLSETTVVLPPTPTEAEIETFVTLMGHFSRQTGFPALRVTVAGPEAAQQGARSDFLIIGTGDDQPVFEKLANHLSVALHSGQVQVHDTQGFFVPLLHHAWWKLESNEHTESGDLTAGGSPDVVIEGIKSPYDKLGDRSIVAIHLKDASVFTPFMDTFMQVQQSSDISGSVSVLHGNTFQSFRIGAEVYHVGVLPWWTRITLWFAEVPWLVAVVVIILAFLLAIWTRQWLRNKARSRLKMVED